MAQILAPYIGKFVLVYLDDICILSSSVEEHYKNLELVFELLSKHLATGSQDDQVCLLQ